MKADATHITIVLDRSGSMDSVKSDTIGGFNSFIKTQQALPGSATLTLIQFDDQYEIVYSVKPIQDILLLNDQTFVPRGSTALLDAMGRAINETGASLAALPEADRPAKVLLVVMTDGMENASREFTRTQVFDKITHQREKYGWEVVFIGANQDAISTGASLGVAASSSLSYAATPTGTKTMFDKLAKSAGAYRAAASAAPKGFFSEEDEK